MENDQTSELNELKHTLLKTRDAAEAELYAALRASCRKREDMEQLVDNASAWLRHIFGARARLRGAEPHDRIRLRLVIEQLAAGLNDELARGDAAQVLRRAGALADFLVYAVEHYGPNGSLAHLPPVPDQVPAQLPKRDRVLLWTRRFMENAACVCFVLAILRLMADWTDWRPALAYLLLGGGLHCLSWESRRWLAAIRS